MDRRAWLRAQPWFTPGAGGADEPIFEGRCTFERDAARALAFRAPLLGAATATPLALRARSVEFNSATQHMVS